MSLIDRQFALAKRDTNLRVEIVGGITSFLAAAYLRVVVGGKH
jgi:xanthine/uracil/vitamin C permease (AzgA family)